MVELISPMNTHRWHNGNCMSHETIARKVATS